MSMSLAMNSSDHSGQTDRQTGLYMFCVYGGGGGRLADISTNFLHTLLIVVCITVLRMPKPNNHDYFRDPAKNNNCQLGDIT